MRLVAYVRVSQEDERPENQEYSIFRWAAQHGHQVVETARDVGVSGALPPGERPGWRRVLDLLDNADGVVVYALDRVARSLWDLAAVVRELESRGKVLVSVREDWLQQLDPKIRSLIVAILGWAAAMEREFIRQRTKEALERLKAQGKHIGRPPKWNEARAGADFLPKFRLACLALGTAAHELAKEKLKEMGAEVEVLAVLRVGRVEVVGYADAVFDDAVVEVKSGARATGQQRVQALAYALALGRSQAFLITRNHAEKVDTKPHKIVVKRARFFYGLLQSSAPPPRPLPVCASCVYARFCNALSRGEVKILPQG